MSRITLRRLRQDAHIRALTREVRPHAEQFIQPLFVVEGLSGRETIPGLTGVYRDTPDTLLRQVEADLSAGCSKFLLFGVPAGHALKDIDWSFTAGQVAALRKRFGRDIWLAVDVCLCSSTPHGHCGVLNPEGGSPRQCREREGAGRRRRGLRGRRRGLRCSQRHDGWPHWRDPRGAGPCRARAHASLMSYSAKFHSNFYGPFRVAADSAPKTGGNAAGLADRASYQIDPARAGDAILSVQRDVEEGADILMVKPGLPYLDLLSDLSREFAQPWAVYEVSGEYAGIELLAEQGLANRIGAHREAWTAFVRAGRVDDHQLRRAPCARMAGDSEPLGGAL